MPEPIQHTLSHLRVSGVRNTIIPKYIFSVGVLMMTVESAVYPSHLEPIPGIHPESDASSLQYTHTLVHT